MNINKHFAFSWYIQHLIDTIEGSPVFICYLKVERLIFDVGFFVSLFVLFVCLLLLFWSSCIKYNPVNMPICSLLYCMKVAYNERKHNFWQICIPWYLKYPCYLFFFFAIKNTPRHTLAFWKNPHGHYHNADETYFVDCTKCRSSHIVW